MSPSDQAIGRAVLPTAQLSLSLRLRALVLEMRFRVTRRRGDIAWLLAHGEADRARVLEGRAEEAQRWADRLEAELAPEGPAAPAARLTQSPEKLTRETP